MSSRWLTFRQPREELINDWGEAIKVLEDLRLIGEVSLHPRGQEIWFMPNGWIDAGLCWSKSWWSWAWVMKAVQK